MTRGRQDYECPYRNKGCLFTGNESAVNNHQLYSCTYRLALVAEKETRYATMRARIDGNRVAGPSRTGGRSVGRSGGRNRGGRFRGERVRGRGRSITDETTVAGNDAGSETETIAGNDATAATADSGSETESIAGTVAGSETEPIAGNDATAATADSGSDTETIAGTDATATVASSGNDHNAL